MKLNKLKKCALTLGVAIMLLSAQQSLAQTGVPKGFNYQAAVRDNKGNMLASKAVKIRVKFTDNSGANLLWQEDFNITTTATGLANMVLGNGTKSAGSKSSISDISWTGSSPKIEVLLDADGSGTYVSMGTNNFWSVPYAFAADSLTKAPKLNYLNDVSKTGPTTGQVLQWNGTQWAPATPAGGGTPGGDVSGTIGSMTVTKIQGESISTTAPSVGQILKWNGTAWAPAADDTSKTKIGSLGGDVSGTLGTTIVTKIQGQPIATAAPTTGYVLKWNGTAWAPAADDTTSHYKLPTPGGDVSGGLTNLSVIKLQGKAVSTTAPTTGQILKWDGTQWKPADTSKAVGGVTTWLKSGSNVYYSGGNVGINTSSPVDRLHIVESLSSKTEGMRVETGGGSSSTGIYYGMYSEMKNTNGLSNAIASKSIGKSSGINVGMSGYGSTAAVQNVGTFGYGTGSTSTALNLGAYGRADSSSSSNIGVQGDANWATTTGSTINEGVVGNASGSSYINNAIFGNTTGTGAQNVGVFGTASGAGTVNVGTFGRATNGSTCYGIYGTAATTSTSLLAGYFVGNVFVNGTLSKSSGSFRIDHPLDPANKYLVHSFVESPDMMNVYNGNVTTDAGGLATIVLPTYFEALNKDFRYQLTPIGTFAQAMVLKEVEGNQFVIKTDKPNVKISWQVTGIRHDPYADKNRIVPEEPKTGNDKGKYLQPALYGQPESMSIYPNPVEPKQVKIK